MKRVLLAWELGGGIGYTGWLIAIAKRLQAQGCETVLALRERFHPCGFADLMLANGFGQTHELHALVRAWRGLIDLVQPGLIVGAYNPVLALPPAATCRSPSSATATPRRRRTRRLSRCSGAAESPTPTRTSSWRGCAAYRARWARRRRNSLPTSI